MCQRHLAAEDEALTRLFEDHINHLVEQDDRVWDDRVIRLLVAAGYTVRM
jgi:hypothetical protein